MSCRTIANVAAASTGHFSIPARRRIISGCRCDTSSACQRGTGPVFRRHSRFVYYHLDDLDAWSRATIEAQPGDD